MGLQDSLPKMYPVDIGSAPIDEAIFPVGKILASSLALKVIQESGRSTRSIITKHCNGDFGDSDPLTYLEGLVAVDQGEDIESFFHFDEDLERVEATLCVWTNRYRSETYMLRMDEF